MLETIKEPRAELSPYAPRIIHTQVHPDKIREIIGSGGKTIKKIVEETGAKLYDIYWTSIHCIGGCFEREAALKIINSIVEEVEVGKIYLGKVVNIREFWRFCTVDSRCSRYSWKRWDVSCL